MSGVTSMCRTWDGNSRGDRNRSSWNSSGRDAEYGSNPMIWLWGYGIWWLVHHGANWFAFAGVLLCIVLVMWWSIVNDALIRKSLVPPEEWP